MAVTFGYRSLELRGEDWAGICSREVVDEAVIKGERAVRGKKMVRDSPDSDK